LRNSYSYDLTNTLQINLTRPASCTSYNTRFMWNHHLLTEAFGVASTATGDMDPPSGRPREEVIIPRSPWILPLIHGSVDQASKVETSKSKSRVRTANVLPLRGLSSPKKFLYSVAPFTQLLSPADLGGTPVPGTLNVGSMNGFVVCIPVGNAYWRI
jgi:hypothetical protein